MKRWIHCGGFYRNININVRKMSVRRTRSVASQVAACLDEEDLRDAAESDEAELVDVPRVDRKKDTRVDAIIEAALDEEERLDELDEFTTAANAHYQAAGICVPDGDAAHVGASAEASLEHEHGMEALRRSRTEHLKEAEMSSGIVGWTLREKQSFWIRRMLWLIPGTMKRHQTKDGSLEWKHTKNGMWHAKRGYKKRGYEKRAKNMN